jgi:hypothetical protein
MANCLVTKLKGVVENPNLPKLGEMTLYYNPGSPTTVDFVGGYYGGGLIWFYTNQTVKITSGNAHFTDADGTIIGTEMSVTGVPAFGSPVKKKLVSEDGNRITFTVSDKYGIDFASEYNPGVYVANFDDFEFCPQIKLVRFRSNPEMTGHLTTMKKFTHVSDININSCPNVSGDLSEFADWTNGPIMWNFNGSALTGDISYVPSHVHVFTGNGGWNFHWTAGRRTGGHALTIWNCVFGTMEEINAYLIDTATATDHTISSASYDGQIVALLRGQDPVLSQEAQAAKETIESWDGYSVTVVRFG